MKDLHIFSPANMILIIHTNQTILMAVITITQDQNQNSHLVGHNFFDKATSYLHHQKYINNFT